MALARGPLHSDIVVNSYLDLTFGRRLGQNVVRAKVPVSNPKTPDQILQRQVFRMVAYGINKVGLNLVGKEQGAELDPFQYYDLQKVSPEIWANVYSGRGLPNGKTTFSVDSTLYATFSEPQVSAWLAFNSALASPWEDVPGGSPSDTPIDLGLACFVMVRMFWRSGYLSEEPKDTPPTWDNTPIPNLKAMKKQEEIVQRRLVRTTLERTMLEARQKTAAVRKSAEKKEAAAKK